MKRILKYNASIREAMEQSITRDKKIILMGLGIDDPSGVFGTTLNLHKKFKNNVFDLPTAENAFTGIALGLSISNFKPIIVHHRVEFSLLSIEQIFNQISKWYFMSAGKVNVPMVIRLIVGKGWGQGPQHAQSLEAIFSHIPGLKVVCPSNAHDAKGMLISSILDPNPVIFFEHRWLHDTKDNVPKKYYKVPIGKAKKIIKGKDITIISYSYSTLEVVKSVEYLKKYNIFGEVIDLRSLRPLDKKTFIDSVKKTKKVLVVDNGLIKNGISAEICAIISEEVKEKIKIRRIGVADTPIPSSISVAKHCYPDSQIITNSILEMLNKRDLKRKMPKRREHMDQPDRNFEGPF